MLEHSGLKLMLGLQGGSLLVGDRDQVPHLWLTARPPGVGGGTCHGAAAGQDHDEAASCMRAHRALLMVALLMYQTRDNPLRTLRPSARNWGTSHLTRQEDFKDALRS